jgi:hypothetical protein
MAFCNYFLRLFALLIFMSLFFCIVPHVSAQAPDLGLGVATYVPVKDQNVEDGSVIISTAEGFYLSRYPYDNTIAGVVTSKPAVILGLKLEDNDYALNTKGTVIVRVNTSNGSIQTGDMLTASLTPGVAMRATRSGTVLGTALQGYDSPDKTQVGKIPVLLNVYFASDIRDKKAGDQNGVAQYWRPSLGVIVAIVTVVLSFIFFGRLASTSIEALGRNPTASGKIRFGILVQVLMLLMLASAGSFIAYLLVKP